MPSDNSNETASGKPGAVQIVLRNSGYETWPWAGSSTTVTCFENAWLIGFIHVFDSTAALLERWEQNQKTVLSRHAAALRAAGDKAWNVYSVFLSGERDPSRSWALQRIEEDFNLTRKIARCNILTSDDVQSALLPLITVRAQPVLGDANFESRLRSRLKEIPSTTLDAFLGDVDAGEVARILGEG